MAYPQTIERNQPIEATGGTNSSHELAAATDVLPQPEAPWVSADTEAGAPQSQVPAQSETAQAIVPVFPAHGPQRSSWLMRQTTGEAVGRSPVDYGRYTADKQVRQAKRSDFQTIPAQSEAARLPRIDQTDGYTIVPPNPKAPDGTTEMHGGPRLVEPDPAGRLAVAASVIQPHPLGRYAIVTPPGAALAGKHRAD